ncbi:hypothetical protein [Paenibacillus sp. GCM10027626]|uniref:hypothetical protein n=1 Tax=Paenibacillus sp. GCM10027626 TaxID=3273411 RepID=UPI003632B9CF
MNKKWLTMGAAFGVGAVMLLASGFSAMAGTSGYEAYKSALKNNISVTSLTNTGSITVTDNGAEVLRADILAKINREQNAMSASVTLGNGAGKHTFQMVKQENKVIFKNDQSDVYRQMDIGEAKWKTNGEHKSGPPKQVETVIDALMGNMKDISTVQDAPDGGKNASLHLSGSQVPAVVNALGSLAVSNLADGGGHWNNVGTESHPFGDLTASFPKLTENVKVQQINLDAGISPENYLDQQKGEIIVTGIDESGLDHTLVVSLDFKLSGFNQTVPDTIDLTGKQIEVMKRKEWNGRFH